MGKDREQPTELPLPTSPGDLVRELVSLRALAENLKDEIEDVREAQSLLETSRDDFAEIHDLAALPLLTLGRDGTIRSANLATAELFEQERSRLVLRSFTGFLHDADRARVADHLGLRGKGRPRACDARLVLSNGTTVPVQIWSRASWRRPDVQHLTLIDLRDRELDAWEKRQLVDAARLAHAESDSKDQLIAVLGHELRAPLTPVLAAATALRRTPGISQELRDVFDVIERNVTTEARLIDDLMDATGIARGKLRLVREPLDVERLVQECIDSSRPQAELRGIHLSFVPAAERPFVAGDGLRLRQVFLNLLTNALKFTPPGGQVWVRTRSGEGGLLAVEVQDDGVGFEPAHAPQLFAAFERLACGPSDPGGLGLGLSISKGLVELHDGRISASSLGPHRGACFVVELPEVERPLQSATIIPPPLELPPVVSASGTVPRRRLLVVEDHADTAEMLRTLLEERGYAVVTAESLKRALAIDVSCIDAIICDLGLPDGSGTELLRALPRDADRPAIALSGYGMAADVENARQAGFDLHLTKPVDFERLLQALESLLGRSSARGSSLATG